MKGPGARAQERFSPRALEDVRREVSDCGGCEVFFHARRDGEGMVVEVQALARGSREAVPALDRLLEEGDVVVHNHPSGFLAPSQADLEVASRLGAEGVGFYIVDNLVERVYAVVEPAQPRVPAPPLDPREVAALMGAEGPLARVHPAFEERPSQERMASEVAAALEAGQVALLEAGTGTGKSLAYLVPSVLWALRGGRRVVVSTNTINLQEQHLLHDLPLVEAVLGTPFKAVLVKGRGNYLCLRKRDLLESDGELLLDLDDLQEFQALLKWAGTTAEGTRSDLSFIPRESNWELFRAESDSCLRARCPHFSRCFFYRSRREAASSQLLLANHHLLFADLSCRALGDESAAIMPNYDAVVLDEAHNVEEVALSYFDSSVGRWGVSAMLGRLLSSRREGRGLLPYALKKALSAALAPEERAQLVHQLQELSQLVPRVRQEQEEGFLRLGQLLLEWLGSGGRENRFRIPPPRREEEGWARAEEEIRGLIQSLRSLNGPLRRSVKLLGEQLEEGGGEELAGPWSDLRAASARLDATLEVFHRVLAGEEEDEVFWADVREVRGRPSVRLHLTPLDAAGMLERTLFAAVEPVVLTSATLAVGGSFDFISGRLGLDRLEAGRVRRQIMESPFDYREQMRVALLDDLPDPGSAGYGEGLAEALLQLTLASAGGTLALFTSYRALDAAYEHCLRPLAERGLELLRQGEAPRTALLARFRGDENSVLFATDSFWEGVDVVGRSLRSVIIARLPFSVPTDPVMEARRQAMVEQGRDPFLEDSLPRAVIRFRQGVGRLIRHREDRGFVVVCDPRAARKRYGRLFVSSLPPAPVLRGTAQRAAVELERFFRVEEGEGQP